MTVANTGVTRNRLKLKPNSITAIHCHFYQIRVYDLVLCIYIPPCYINGRHSRVSSGYHKLEIAKI